MIALPIRRPLLAALLLGTALAAGGLSARAQETDEEEYKAQIPDVSIYKAMLDANCLLYTSRCV